MHTEQELINLNDYEARARSILPQPIYDFCAGGAHGEYTLTRNRQAFEGKKFLPRVLCGVSNPKTAVELCGMTLHFPILSAPMAFQRLLHPEAELAMARALAKVGVSGIISTMASESLEKIMAAADLPLMFQLYIFKDRAITLDLIQRAEKSGYRAIVLTVDAPIMATRERDVRNKFSLSDDQLPENFSGLKQLLTENKNGSAIKHFTDQQLDSSLTWKDIDWLKNHIRLPILLKGIMHPRDAEIALGMEIAGLIVSNHGGRQSDCAPATLDALEAISRVVNRRIPVLIDGGIRHGSDIFVAMMLGATAVLVGRPLLWGLAVNGAKGVEGVLDLLCKQLIETMILMGISEFDGSVMSK